MEEEESFSLTWSGNVQTEEVICDNSYTEIPLGEAEEFEEAVENGGEVVQEENIMYISDDNVLVMQQSSDEPYMVTEEVVSEQWVEGACPEEIVVGSEEAVVESGEPIEEEEIPLPTDQDEYTAARPYPCDFCSRRFRKKANLMNHMVAHQTDRPHGCNLCGVRYIRKCDLMNHLKIHAYIPDENEGEEDTSNMDEEHIEAAPRKRGRPPLKKKKKPKIKEEYMDSFESEEGTSSRTFAYGTDYDGIIRNPKQEYPDYEIEEHHPSEVRYPITDPKKPFVCQHCGVSFAREKALASHARVHGGDSPFECHKCGEMFWDLNLMQDHLKSKHGDHDDYAEEDDYSEEENKYGTYYCSTCGLSFHRQDNLKRHQKVHVKEEFSIQESEVLEEDPDQDLGHICNVCGENFPEALDLLAHAEVHARSNLHRCMICGEMCPDEQTVASHVQSMHKDEITQHTCLLCGRTCKDRRTLLKHSWEHTKEKMFECTKCQKTFHNKARLKRHMFSHRNKNVTCDECGEEFPDGRTLMNHRHSHSSVSGRQFPCRECGKTFGSRSSQQIHIRIHTGERPYGCRFCWKAFADGGTLRKHERIHTGEKPYACAVCPRAFNQRVVLREHIRSHHSGPDPKYSHSMTPFCCSVCSDMFATSQDLILHLIHHCDMNTAMKRLPQVGPRKYKRRRKLKPHELDMITARQEEEIVEHIPEQFNTDSDMEVPESRKYQRKTKKSPNKTPPQDNSYTELYNSCSSAIEDINMIVNQKSPPKMKKSKPKDNANAPSRPKMIHTQKTRVPVDGEDGRIRHKTKTIVSRTHPTELKSSTGERIRPRTKNVSYHVFNTDKLPLATFPEDDAAVNNLLKDQETNGISFVDSIDTPELAAEQTVSAEQVYEEDDPVPTNIIKIETRSTRSRNNALRPGRTIIGPGSKVVRIVKGGLLVSKRRKNTTSETEEPEPENIFPDIPNFEKVDIKDGYIKNEHMDPSPLHELAEISMQHAQNTQSLYKCEMCSEVFTDRAQLLVHVPIHI